MNDVVVPCARKGVTSGFRMHEERFSSNVGSRVSPGFAAHPSGRPLAGTEMTPELSLSPAGPAPPPGGHRGFTVVPVRLSCFPAPPHPADMDLVMVGPSCLRTS